MVASSGLPNKGVFITSSIRSTYYGGQNSKVDDVSSGKNLLGLRLVLNQRAMAYAKTPPARCELFQADNKPPINDVEILPSHPLRQSYVSTFQA